MDKPKRQKKRSKVAEKRRVSKKMHTSRCAVCKSPYRKEIEEAYVAWEVPRQIGEDWGVSGDSVERHARALGLRAKRDKDTRGALTEIMRRGMRSGLPVKPESVLSAVKLRAQLDGDFVEKHEERLTVDASKRVQKRVDRLVDAIGGKPDDVELSDGDPDK